MSKLLDWLLCWLGWHKLKYLDFDSGQSRVKCVRCHKKGFLDSGGHLRE